MSNVGFTPWPTAGSVPDRGRLVMVDDRRGIVRAVGVATTVATGALAMALMAPQTAAAGPVLSSPVQLLSSPLQSAVDQLLDAQQHITATNGDYPWITPFDLTLLPGYTQTLAYTQLGIALDPLTSEQFHVLSGYNPLGMNALAADPQPFFVVTNPDDQYVIYSLNPDQTYTVTVDPGLGSQDVTFAAYANDGVLTPWAPTGVVTGLSEATPNPDGTYTFVLSSTQPPGTPDGNWLDIAGAQTLVTRDTVGDWGLPHAGISLEGDGGPSTFTLPLLSDDQIASLLSTVATGMHIENGPGATYYAQPKFLDSLPVNHATPIMESAKVFPGITLPGQLSSLGHFSLEPDQALVVKVPEVDAAYSGFQLVNGWGVDSPYAAVQGSLNGVQAFHDPDGYVYYVISSQDPGVANWLDNSDLANGGFVLRWQGATDFGAAVPVETQVVNVADISQYLPADTPLVSAADRAADIQERLFNYDYVNNQNNGQDDGLNWLTSHLELDQIKAAIGADQYHEIFGGQTDVPSVLDRMMSPELSPNLGGIANEFAANPDGSWSAIVNNLPLAVKDIMLPGVLAALRLDLLAAQMVQSVQGDLSTGQLPQLWADLGTGFQGFGTVFNDMFTDPATSITAGFLNARDDLAVSIMHADSYSPLSSGDFTSVADELAQFQQSVSQMLSAGSSAVLDSTDFASLGAALPLDLLP